MITPNVVVWQWEHYPEAHGDRRNLAIHLLTTPLFWVGLLCIFMTPLSLPLIVIGVVLLAAAFVAQAVGHRLERNPPQPFRSPVDLVVRFVIEQFWTFPKFLVTGGWARAWREAG